MAKLLAMQGTRSLSELAFTPAEQFRWALAHAAVTCGLSQRRLAKALNVHEVSLSRWLSADRVPAKKYWDALTDVIAGWLDPHKAKTQQGKRMAHLSAAAFVGGPFAETTPAIWANVLMVDESLFADVPRDAGGNISGLAVGAAITSALRERGFGAPGDSDPVIQSIRDMMAIDRLHLELVRALKERRATLDALHDPKVQKKLKRIYNEACKHPETLGDNLRMLEAQFGPVSGNLGA